ncbi:peroxisomal membrane anchor protein conserved region-domain-containing protein [Epithele typhae]|uniref:peroxisomal membrane anchor protein conserved region-domain-containing protein n=1 Tax=Epithele typhae TaxID=378194 RepID=UPI0020081A8E|nr:peroxisomal membrane anchor protein conserved region-domain-containing protein [Epithele typhae]KAH9944075.1 peroxisomal membrane anchor protein conserved region-domain-containing protein [Epithele typhae]
MATPDRVELVRNAVAFLSDPKMQASPLAQRIQFLEAKGLNGPEIEEAMRQAAVNQSASRTSMQGYQATYGPAYGPMPYTPVQPPPPQWDWRDYFITAVVSGTVAYGAASLFRKYVMPHLRPPSATAYEQDRDAMTAQFDAAEALLKEIQSETAAVRTAVDQQNEKVVKVTGEVEAVVKHMREGEARTRDEMREIRDEVNNVRDMLPKMIDKTKESHAQGLAELQQELKSLKALLLSRGPVMSGPSTPILPGKPSLPAWQLAGGGPQLTSMSPNPLSPSSTPLPDSPLTSPTSEEPLSLDAVAGLLGLDPAAAPEHTATGDVQEPETTAQPSPSAEPNALREASESSTAPLLQDAISLAVEHPAAIPAPSSERSSSLESSATDTPAAQTSSTDTDTLPQSPLHLQLSLETLPDGDASAEAIIVGDDDQRKHTSEEHAVPNGKVRDGVDVDALQKRLKLVEQRFTDVSTSFKRLQAEKRAADLVLRELTSVESVSEVEALREFLQNLNFKTEMAQDEIRRLTGKLTRNDERIEELRDIHRLESKSQSDQIDKLKVQLDEAEKLLKASEGSSSQAEQEISKLKADTDRLQGELTKAMTTAKDEEEKRSKAIALLKTVRQKLVKAEKERDDAMKEFGALKDAEKGEREKEKTERAKFQAEIERVNAERESAVQGLRAQFDREVIALKERLEKEMTAMKGQYELEAITSKTTHVKEIENKKTRISDLEGSVRTMSREKDELFDQLQLRQAELESLRSSLESLQGQNTELQYQLREAQDRIALLQDEFSDARRNQDLSLQSSGPSAEEVTRLLMTVESKAEAKLGDLRRRLTEAERERDEGEAHWSKKLAEHAREIEALKTAIQSSQRSKEEEMESAQSLRKEIEQLQSELREHQKQIVDLHAQSEKAEEVESVAKTQVAVLGARAADLQTLVEESKGREAQLKAQNKTLREELRKVQSSVTLLEKQRGPGVGYWASRNDSTSDVRSPTSSVSELPQRETSSRPTSPSMVKSEEEVNFEYLRNVIMQFLEHKEMRPHLIRILSTILRFTPQETRRLISKV